MWKGEKTGLCGQKKGLHVSEGNGDGGFTNLVICDHVAQITRFVGFDDATNHTVCDDFPQITCGTNHVAQIM